MGIFPPFDIPPANLGSTKSTLNMPNLITSVQPFGFDVHSLPVPPAVFVCVRSKGMTHQQGMIKPDSSHDHLNITTVNYILLGMVAANAVSREICAMSKCFFKSPAAQKRYFSSWLHPLNIHGTIAQFPNSIPSAACLL